MKHVLITIVAVVLLGCGNSEANQALLDAAKFGNIKAAKEAIADGADVNAKEQRDPGWTPLHIATQLDHKEIAKLLIINDAYVNAKDNKDETPLNMAYISDQTEIADLLSKHGGKTGFQLQSSGN